MTYRPDLQFGLSEIELRIARKALRLADDAQLSVDDYHSWVLVKDTWLQSISGPDSHPGGPEQRKGYRPTPVVETKKVVSMAKYKR